MYCIKSPTNFAVGNKQKRTNQTKKDANKCKKKGTQENKNRTVGETPDINVDCERAPFIHDIA